ncbi:DUF1800 domain-containing protein [Sphingomonas sp. CCH5-D11]|uniref:DUF1800 domain-containing protein n=1 Tax=Sphingomonas sp. CCH5-D11 TaxID=1768786 RepID=UPI000ABF9DBB|nr:DUF1800 domain-containing protein [Sphingomonas sp. CCH5-D11]
MNDRSIALNRFGLGGRADDPAIDSAQASARDWLVAQMRTYEPSPPALRYVARTDTILNDLADYQAQARAVRRNRPDGNNAQVEAAAASMVDEREVALIMRKETRRTLRSYYADAVKARVRAAFETSSPFAERLVHFWSNHFAVSADKISVSPLAGAFEFEAIRPNVMGKFGAMLKAAEQHPAMLLYLDQADSIGPGSRFGQRPRVAARQGGLNENLAREILELHTLGVRTGYNQADVVEFARALTGWTVPGIGRRTGVREVTGGFAFVPELHEPGTRTIMGAAYPQEGQEQAEAVLADLARNPATAAHIATKLARHFAGDAPPAAMIERLKQAFLRSDGDLPTVYRAIIDSPEAWVAEPVKFRSPWEWSVAALRALGSGVVDSGASLGLQDQLGQKVWKPGQPSGFDDTAAAWAGPDALMRRVEAAERLAQRTGVLDASELAAKLFAGSVTQQTSDALRRAESPGQALALLLVSPDMMRR